MAVLHAAGAPLRTSGYTLLIADDPNQVAAAQRLRHEVFATELGATLRPGAAGLDVDEFDEYCDHLIVREDAPATVVGTYRLLPPGRTGRRYADGEFDLTALRPLRDQLVETGRSCVHPDHRSGAVVNLMWAGIARYLHLRRLALARRLRLGAGRRRRARPPPGSWAEVAAGHLAPPPLRVRPLRPWFAEPGAATAGRSAHRWPGRARRWSRRCSGATCGSELGRAASRPTTRTSGCADFYVLFSLDRMNPRYLRHFLGGATR